MRGSLLAATLAALVCLGAASSARAQVVISLDGECPGRMAVEWENAPSNRPGGLLFAFTTGNYYIGWGWCEGTYIGLGSSLRLVHTIQSGSNGSGMLTGSASARACGGYI
ncbi:MAG: hypothetical protein KJZ69_01105 [Phycisphaerales bacterium]|nr:hypothetical protein [Phycisphaerales bacterium]